jgi:Putative transposase/Transposase zinc-binding domain
MCQHQENTGGATATGEDKFRLADFFDRWWDTYKQSPSEYIAPEQYKAVNAMRVCRTEALGVDYYACPDCGEVTKVYHSCKNRFCPTCSWKDTVRWADRLKNQMMDLPHRHTVMTLPHQFNHLIKENKKGLLSALMRVAADTLKDWMAHKYNINPGIISVLHTFGETKEFHVHVHMIVSWGGLDIKTKELRPIKGEYIDYNFLKNKFRCKFEDQLVAMYDKGTLEHNFSDRIQFLKFIKSANQNKWIIHLEPPMDIPTQVIRYIGRYSKRACLSEYKITKMDGETICFRYKDYKTLDSNNKPIERELEMNYRDFFPRLLQHVPLPYFRIVRYYGMYANRSDIPLQYLYNEKEETKTEDRESVKMEKTAENPLVCSYCQTRKVYLYTKLKSRYANKTIVFKRVFINNSKPHDQIAA